MAEATGLGTTFMRETVADSGIFTAIAHVATITFSDDELTMVEVNQLDPEDGFKKSIPSLSEGGEATVVLNFVSGESSHEDLKRDKDTRTPCKYRIQFPFDDTQYLGGDYYEITGQVTKYSMQEIAASEVLQVEVIIRATAKMKYVPLESIL